MVDKAAVDKNLPLGIGKIAEGCGNFGWFIT
jgi:hypothetical protein